MLRRLFLIALFAVLAAPLAAQAPEGWMVRVDNSTNADDPDDNPKVKFVSMGKGFHITSGPAEASTSGPRVTFVLRTDDGGRALVAPIGIRSTPRWATSPPRRPSSSSSRAAT